ncbi:hypothetical protein C8R43DRAFT_887005, partial [Mycena crocata]
FRSRYSSIVGSTLRARYQPDWIPSWLETRKPGNSKDSLGLIIAYEVLDAATRIRDNSKVALKRVETESQKMEIFEYLPSLRDERKPTTPLLEIIYVPPANSISVLVMPYTRRFNHPAFHCRAEFIEAMQQFLEVRRH